MEAEAGVDDERDLCPADVCSTFSNIELSDKIASNHLKEITKSYNPNLHIHTSFKMVKAGTSIPTKHYETAYPTLWYCFAPMMGSQ